MEPRTRVRYPPFFAGPAPGNGAGDYQSRSGAERLAEIIRQAWLRCDVRVPLRIEETVGNVMGRGPSRVLYVVRVELPGGLPEEMR